MNSYRPPICWYVSSNLRTDKSTECQDHDEGNTAYHGGGKKPPQERFDAQPLHAPERSGKPHPGHGGGQDVPRPLLDTLVNYRPLPVTPQAESGVAALWSPNTGIVDYVAVTSKYAEIVQAGGGEIRLGTEVKGIEERPGELIVKTSGGEVTSRTLINCAGLQSDLVAKMMGDIGGLRIVPFRGEYYELAAESRHLVQGLIYPVPDPRFPFLGVHFTKKIDGGIEAGPNAVLALAREGYSKSNISVGHALGLFTFPGFWIMASKYWEMGFGEIYRSLNKQAFVTALQQLLPELGIDDVKAGGAGVRAQAMDSKGNLLDDFRFVESANAVHVLNAPSPAATASIVIGRAIADRALQTFDLET